jgi:alanyl-tRNA synthetase
MFEMLETGHLVITSKELFLDVLTEVLKLDKDRLYVSVLKETKQRMFVRPKADIWKQFVSESEYFWKTKDNFWEMVIKGLADPVLKFMVTCSGGELLSQVLGLGILIIPQV